MSSPFTAAVPFAVPVGALVEVTYLLGLPFLCVQFLRISNLPEWSGQKKPGERCEQFLLQRVEWRRFAQCPTGGTGISVETVASDCIVVDGGGVPCGTNLQNYAYRFSHAGAAPLTLMQGEEATWSLSDQTFAVRNHRSFRIGIGGCDNWLDWGFSIASR
jgi:hypothetical protein